MKKEFRLYNVLFPMWMFWYLPLAAELLQYSWVFRFIVLAVLLGNFAVDSLVVCLAAKRMGLEDRRQLWKKSIWRVWGIGFLCDFIGAALIFGLALLLSDVFNAPWSFVTFPSTTLIALPGVLLAGVLIYFINRKFSFAKCGLDPAQVRKLSLALAVFTAPYTMLIPLYG